jgi:hypothetical protein
MTSASPTTLIVAEVLESTPFTILPRSYQKKRKKSVPEKQKKKSCIMQQQQEAEKEFLTPTAGLSTMMNTFISFTEEPSPPLPASGLEKQAQNIVNAVMNLSQLSDSEIEKCAVGTKNPSQLSHSEIEKCALGTKPVMINHSYFGMQNTTFAIEDCETVIAEKVEIVNDSGLDDANALDNLVNFFERVLIQEGVADNDEPGIFCSNAQKVSARETLGQTKTCGTQSDSLGSDRCLEQIDISGLFVLSTTLSVDTFHPLRCRGPNLSPIFH